MAYTNVYDTTFPPDTQAAKLGAKDIRDASLNIMQRVASFGAGLLAARPTPETTGATVDWTGVTYLATDTFQLFRWSGTAWVDITASTPGGTLVGSADLINHGTFVPSTPLYVVPVGGAGIYQFYAYLNTHTAGSGTIFPVVIYNDGFFNRSVPGAICNLAQATGNASGPGVGDLGLVDFSFYVPDGQTISYDISVGVAIGGGATFDSHVRLVRVG